MQKIRTLLALGALALAALAGCQHDEAPAANTTTANTTNVPPSPAAQPPAPTSKATAKAPPQGGCPHAAKKGGCEHAAKQGGCPHATKEGGCEHAAKQGGCEHATKEGGCEHAAKEGGCPHAAEEGGSAQAAKGGCGSCAQKANAEVGGGHACGGSNRVEITRVEQRKDKAGKAVTHVGKELTGAARARVNALLDKPAEFTGKTVTLEGHVSAMCHHKRRWFAVVDDKSGRHVRVLTAPVFLTPAGSIGKRVRVEGSVEQVEVSAAMARHLSGSHKLAGTGAIKAGPRKVVVLRATVAQFY